MLSVKVVDYGETDDNMHYVTYRASGLSERELDFLLDNLEGETVVEDGDLLLNIFIQESSSHSLQMMHISNWKTL